MGDDRPKYKRPFLPVKYDVIFRLFFADERNEEELIGFLKSILRLPEDEYESIEIADPHLLPEYVGDKLAVIDVKLYTKSRKVIHIEVQLQVKQFMKNRIVFYDAKLITEQMGSKDQYDKIQKVISIVITEENLIPDSQWYHHRFTFCDLDTGVELTDIIEIHSIELRKLPASADGTALYDWAKFIAAETEEELNMVAQRNPEIKRAAVKLRELSADERARDMLERREKGWRDVEAFADEARQEGRAEGLAEGRTEGLTEGRTEGLAEGFAAVIRNAIIMGMDADAIAKLTGLTREEINLLADTQE